jgi:hypothetical protein
MSRTIPPKTGMMEIITPNTKEARISPRMIVWTVRGEFINLSKVLACVSQGATAGDIEVAVKKSTMPSSPGIRNSTVRFLPTAKDKNRKMGKRIPNITTGPLE